MQFQPQRVKFSTIAYVLQSFASALARARCSVFDSICRLRTSVQDASLPEPLQRVLIRRGCESGLFDQQTAGARWRPPVSTGLIDRSPFRVDFLIQENKHD